MNTQAMQAQSRSEAGALPWYRHRWPWLLMLGPGLVVVAGCITMWLALRTQDALVVDDYYKQGKAINQDLRRARNAASLGMGMSLAYQPAEGVLRGQLQGDAAARSSALKLRLVHSTQAAKDMVFMIQPNQKGEFSAALPMLEMARWQVVVEDVAGQWRLQGTWQWPQERALSLAAEGAVRK